MPGPNPTTSNLSNSTANPAKIVTLTGDENQQELLSKAKLVVRELGFLIINELGIEDARLVNESVLQNLIMEIYDRKFNFDTSPVMAGELKDSLRNSVASAVQAETASLVFTVQLARIGKTVINAFGEFSHRLKEFGADPVMLFNGQFTHTAEDININGAGMDFTLARTYKNQVSYKGPLGHNWDHNYNLWLRLSQDEQTVFRSNGALREDSFSKHPNFDYWVPPAGEDGIILREGSSFVFRKPDGTRYIYKQQSQQLNKIHFIDRIEDRFTNYLRFYYLDERLDQIEINHTKRFVKFHYDGAGRIKVIQDYTHRIWKYYYDDLDDLIAATTASTNRYPTGLTTCYEYSSSQYTGGLQHNLLNILDAKGQMYLENEYGTDAGFLSYNRVIQQRQGNGTTFFDYEDVIEEFALDYTDQERPAHQTTVTHRNGHTTRHIYNKFGNLLFKEECVLIQGLPKLLRTHYRYNIDGNLMASLSPGGVMTQMLYGRTWFEKQHQIQNSEESKTHPDLNQQDRQSFNRILTVIHRKNYFNMTDLNLSRDIWGDIFPDIFQANETDDQGNAADTIIKLSYELDYGQVRTRSDPRYTNSPIPGNANEHPRYEETLTRFTFTGPPGDSQLFLAQIHHPRPTLPDSTQGNEVIEKFDAYDAKGRLLRQVNPAGVVQEFTYFPENQGEIRSGYLTKIVQDKGILDITTEYEVDDLGRVIVLRQPRSSEGNDDRFTIQNQYNNLDQLSLTISSKPFEFKTRIIYDQNGMMERMERDVSDHLGNNHPDGPEVRTCRYDTELNPLLESMGGRNLSNHLITKYLYGSAGEKISEIFPKGNSTHYFYDERLNLSAVTEGFCTQDSATTHCEYDADGRLFKSTDALGQDTYFAYDAFGRLVSKTNALGNITCFTYDKNDNKTVERFFELQNNGTYLLLARSEMVYDELNRPVQTVLNRFDNFPGPVSKANLDHAFIDAPGPGDRIEYQSYYDEMNRIVKQSDPLGRETTWQYDALNRIKIRIDPLGNRIESSYDAHNNLIRQDQIDLIQDSNSGIVTGQRVFSNTFSYDELDRIISSIDPLGNETKYNYDSRNQLLVMMDPHGNRTLGNFDIYGRKIRIIEEQTTTGLGNGIALSPAIQSYAYDDNSNVVEMTDALTRRTRFEFDALDRRISIIFSDGSRRLYDYDANFNVIQITDNNGLKKIYTYDELNRNTGLEVDPTDLPDGFTLEGESFRSYDYDGLNRLIKEENDFCASTYKYNSLDGRIEDHINCLIPGVIFNGPLHIIRSYNNVGDMDRIRYPKGRQLRYHRDDLERLIKVENESNGGDYPGGTNISQVYDIARMEYRGLQRSKCIFGNQAEIQYNYDPGARLIQIQHQNSANTILTQQYLYDAVGNLRVHNDLQPSGNKSFDYSYDSFYRVIHEFTQMRLPFDPQLLAPPDTIQPGAIPNFQDKINNIIGSLDSPPGPKSYEYDLTGNRLVERMNNGNENTYSVNNLDQYNDINGEKYFFDKNGNLTRDHKWRYVYNANNQLIRVVDISSSETFIRYYYDASGRKILEEKGDESKFLVYNGYHVISEYHEDELFAQYVYDDGIDQPLQMATEEETYWYHADLIGSIRNLSNSSGDEAASYAYSSFGVLLESSSDSIYNPLLYASRRFDREMGIYDNRNRHYDPGVGRFLQRDPAGMRDGTNLYVYTGNNPLVYTDPMGMESRPEHNKPDLSLGYSIVDLPHRPWKRLDPFYTGTETEIVESDPIRLGHQTKIEELVFSPKDLKDVLLWGLPDNSDLTEFESNITKGRIPNRSKYASLQVLIDPEGGTTGYELYFGSGWGSEYYSRYGELLHATGEAGLESPGFTPLDAASLGAGLLRGVAKHVASRITKKASKKVAGQIDEPDVLVHELFTERIKGPPISSSYRGYNTSSAKIRRLKERAKRWGGPDEGHVGHVTSHSILRPGDKGLVRWQSPSRNLGASAGEKARVKIYRGKSRELGLDPQDPGNPWFTRPTRR